MASAIQKKFKIVRRTKEEPKTETEDPSFRLIDFNVTDSPITSEESDSSGSDESPQRRNYTDDGEYVPNPMGNSKKSKFGDKKVFRIQMFGINEKGETCSIFVDDYLPFFYVKVDDTWTSQHKREFIEYLKKSVGSFYQNSIIEDKCKFVNKRKLYGFDGGKEHKFILITFKNVPTMNKVKNMWYERATTKRDGTFTKLREEGLLFKNTNIMLYEANIPPLLRFFHIRDISPSGWVQLPTSRIVPPSTRTTTCTYEYKISEADIIPLNQKETIVPYKICSFDIEASSSHGDFPIPVKTYKKLATNIIDSYAKLVSMKKESSDYTASASASCSSDTNTSGADHILTKDILTRIINTAFGYDTYPDIETVYPKRKPSQTDMNRLITMLLSKQLKALINVESVNDDNTIERMFEKMKQQYAEKPKEENAGTTSSTSGSNDGDNNDNDNDEDDEDNDDEERDDDSCHGEGEGEGDGESMVVTDKKILKARRNDAIAEEVAASASNSSFHTPPPATLPTHNLTITILDLINGKSFDRETKITYISNTLGSVFPKLEGDKVTFIGSTFIQYGKNNNTPYLNHCIVMDTCDSLEGKVSNSVIESYKTEREVLVAWTDLIQRENPDIIIGYNIFGFDYEFMFRRSLETNCETEFLQLSRNNNEFCGKTDEKTGKVMIEESSIVLASGQYDLRFIKMSGRLQIDLYNYFRRDFNLTSYKLDYVASSFIGDGVKRIEHMDNGRTRVYTGNMTGLEEGNFISFEESSHSTDNYKDGQKFEIIGINYDARTFEIAGHESPDMKKSVRWGLAKDDVTPQDIFRMTKEGPSERAIIAKYCIQDCNLVHHLMNKIDVMTGYIEMSKICSVPIGFLVMRGQGIKLTSYIAKKCSEKNTLMPVIDKDRSDSSYEGAIVLPPKCNLYLDNPVACLDYSSLYPSSMISENLSHDSKVWTKEYDLFGNLIRETGEKDVATDRYIYDNLPGYEYVDVEYDTYKWVANSRGKAIKTLNGKKVCRWAQPKDGVKAIMPSVLEELLAARKATRKLAESQSDPFMANILDKRQLGYKVTANSLYGQCGAKTSTFYEVDVAASTTATGRKLLTYGKRIVEEVYGDATVNTKNYGFVNTKAEYIYGDTDSVFFTFNLATPDGTPIRGKDALEITIEIAQQVGHLASKFLKPPHAWVYEKTLMPFCLLSKKRYVGMLYETKPEKAKRKSMGIVLKRRDNAPIVKDVYGGIIDILMKEQNIEQAIAFLRQCMQNIIDGKCPLEKLIITKSLRSDYKNPQQIAHKVLADRMGVRDPGNKPGTGDRIPYVYINNNAKGALQGDKIEHPDYIIKNKIRPNYSFYITNQIMKPVQQLFALVLEKIPGFDKKCPMFHDRLETMISQIDENEKEKQDKKRNDIRNKAVKTLLFDEFLEKANNINNGNKEITSFFKKKVV